MCGTPRRRRDFSQAARQYSGEESTARLPCSSTLLANLVARKMWSRLPGLALNHLPVVSSSVYVNSDVRMSGINHTEEILAVLVHVGAVPEELAILVQLVQDLEALLVWLRLAVEGTLDHHQPNAPPKRSFTVLTSPIVPYPSLVTCGPFLPNLAVGSLLPPPVTL